jgi:hypothetical protein
MGVKPFQVGEVVGENPTGQRLIHGVIRGFVCQSAQLTPMEAFPNAKPLGFLSDFEDGLVFDGFVGEAGLNGEGIRRSEGFGIEPKPFSFGNH